MTGTLEYFQRLEPEIKVFRFEKEELYYEELTKEQQEDEARNIKNGLNFVHKVLAIGECDVVVLDEILGLVDLGIITVEEVIALIQTKSEDMEMILTGRNLPEELEDYADYISRLNIIKFSE